MNGNKIANQYYYNGPGYLDGKIQPVETVADLDSILTRQRFEGLTVTVLRPDGANSTPCDYWLVQDPNDEPGVLMWVRKTAGGGETYTFKTDTEELLDVSVDENNVVTINATDALASAVTNIDNVLNEVEQIKTDVADVQSGLTQTNEKVNTIETRVDTLESGLTQTNERVETVETAVTTTIERVNTIETAVTTTVERVEVLESGLTQVESGVTVLQDIVSILQSGVTENKEDISRLESGLTETNTVLTEVKETADNNAIEIENLKGWHIQNLGNDSGTTRYALVDASGETKGDVIEVVDDQFLTDVIYISAATEADKAIDSSVIIGDPYLKFTWQYDLITYVPVKDWVNNYEGGKGISIESSGNTNIIDVKLAPRDEENLNYLSLTESGLTMNIMIEINEE